MQAVLEEASRTASNLRHGAEVGVAVCIEHDEGIVCSHLADGVDVLAEGLARRGVSALGNRAVAADDVFGHVNLGAGMEGQHDDDGDVRVAALQALEEAMQTGIERVLAHLRSVGELAEISSRGVSEVVRAAKDYYHIDPALRRHLRVSLVEGIGVAAVTRRHMRSGDAVVQGLAARQTGIGSDVFTILGDAVTKESNLLALPVRLADLRHIDRVLRRIEIGGVHFGHVTHHDGIYLGHGNGTRLLALAIENSGILLRPD